MKRLHALLAATLAATTFANADLVISEIDLTNNKLEILNTGPGTENLTGYYLCNRLNGSPFYPAITTSLIDLPNSSSSTLTLAAGQWVTLQMTAGFIPDASGEVGLYTTNANFGLAANLRDYVGWGADGFRDSVAASKGIWGSATFVSVTGITAGQTIQLGAGLAGNSVADYSLAASTIGVNQVTPPPTATTGSASGITSVAATVAGTVNAKGASTTVTIEYGETASYGSSVTATPSPVTGLAPTSISGLLTGLTASTTYHYRVVATNAYGTDTGDDATFTTAAPPTVALLNITAVSRSGNALTVDFTGPPNTLPATWQVAGTSTLASFTDNKTADSTITEIPAGSGNYRAVIDVTGEPASYFVRIVLP